MCMVCAVIVLADRKTMVEHQCVLQMYISKCNVVFVLHICNKSDFTLLAQCLLSITYLPFEIFLLQSWEFSSFFIYHRQNILYLSGITVLAYCGLQKKHWFLLPDILCCSCSINYENEMWSSIMFYTVNHVGQMKNKCHWQKSCK